MGSVSMAIIIVPTMSDMPTTFFTFNSSQFVRKTFHFWFDMVNLYFIRNVGKEKLNYNE